MQNYLDPVTNPDVVEVANQGWEILNLSIDWVYSMLLFVIYFVQTNFVSIAILAILGFVIGYGIKKIASKGKKQTSVV